MQTSRGPASGASRWVAGLFGLLFLVSAIICFINPEDTFAGLADILGLLFLLKAYVLLVFAGIRALLEGITDLVRALEIREAHQQL